MYQRRDYREDEQVTVGFKAAGKLATAVHAAAEKSGYPSTTQWLRRVATDAAAELLGVPVASLEPAKRGARPGAAPSPESMAKVAQVNAALLDAEATIKRLTDALRAASGEAPARPATRRR